jgi:hypothetical protein
MTLGGNMLLASTLSTPTFTISFVMPLVGTITTNDAWSKAGNAHCKCCLGWRARNFGCEYPTYHRIHRDLHLVVVSFVDHVKPIQNGFERNLCRLFNDFSKLEPKTYWDDIPILQDEVDHILVGQPETQLVSLEFQAPTSE